MAVYGAGRSRFLADYTKEKNIEQKRLEEEYAKAMRARQVEAKRKSWWSGGLGALGALFGPVGLVVGYGAGKLIGGAGTYEGKAVEKHGMTTDKEKFGKWHKESGRSAALTQQRGLDTMDREDWQGDIADIGKVGLQAYIGGGGKFTEGLEGVKQFDPMNWDTSLFSLASSEANLMDIVFQNREKASMLATESIDPDFLSGIYK